MRKTGRKNKEYSAEFKIGVIMDMREHHLSYYETVRKYWDIEKGQEQNYKNAVQRWERIYLEEGAEGLMKERRGRKSKGRPPKLIDPYIHSSLGDFAQKSKIYSNGRMVNGRHGEENIKLLQKKGIQYSIEQTYSNGVRIGGIENHKSKSKILGTKGQAWFPENWTEDDVYLADIYVANLKNIPLVDGYHKTAVYNNVAVRVLFDPNETTKISTICPDLDQNLYIKEVVMKWKNQ